MEHERLEIPEELIQRRQWVVWRAEERDGSTTKVPYQPSGALARTNDPRTWSDYATACQALSGGRYSGVGFVFSEDDPYVGIDLDDCLDERGRLLPWAADIVSAAQSYTEISPSGRGVKIWIRGQLDRALVLPGRHIEVYARGRYFTVTGRRYPGTPLQINDGTRVLFLIHHQMKQLQAGQQQRQQSPSVAPPALSHEETPRAERYSLATLEGVLRDLAASVEGRRNIDLNRAAWRLGKFVGQGLLERAEVEHVLLDAGLQLGLGQREVAATIRSGLNAGIRESETLRLPFDPTRRNGSHPASTAAGAPDATDEAEEPPVDRSWLSLGITARELQHKQFRPLAWPVREVLPEGAALLAGKPKTYKSWLALHLAYAVATGTPALGRFDVEPGRVLYLDLESNQRRMQARLRAMLGDETEWPDNLHIFEQWERGDRALYLLEEWMRDYPDTILIVIDILQGIRLPRDKNKNPYEDDYNAVKPLNAFGEQYRTALLMIHHTRKQKSDDVFDEISGTTGLAGGVSTMWVLSRVAGEQQVMTLAVRGRDVILDDDLALVWDDETCRHHVAGTAHEAAMTRDRREVLEAFEAGQDYTIQEIAERLQRPYKAMAETLRRLVASGHLIRTRYGRYGLPVRQTPATPPAQPEPSGTLDMSDPLVALTPRLSHAERLILRMYLRSEQERDQERARELCEEYGLAYEEARQAARQEG